MNYRISIIAGAALLAITQSANAEGFSKHSQQALAHSGQAITHGSVAVVKATASAAAAPFVVVGKIGEASAVTGDALLDAAEQDFEISEHNIVSMPAPNEALDPQ